MANKLDAGARMTIGSLAERGQAVVHIDNVKTGMARGAALCGEINRHYRAYARGAGLHVHTGPPHHPQDKGKAERVIWCMPPSSSKR